MAIEINELRIQDHDALATMWHAMGAGRPMPFESANALEDFLAHNAGLSVVARHEGNIVGAVLCRRDGNRGCINELAIDPSHRDSDLPRNLFDKAMRKLVSQGIHRLNIQLPDDSDEQAFWRTIVWSDRPRLKVVVPVNRSAGSEPQSGAEQRHPDEIGTGSSTKGFRPKDQATKKMLLPFVARSLYRGACPPQADRLFIPVAPTRHERGRGVLHESHIWLKPKTHPDDESTVGVVATQQGRGRRWSCAALRRTVEPEVQ